MSGERIGAAEAEARSAEHSAEGAAQAAESAVAAANAASALAQAEAARAAQNRDQEIASMNEAIIWLRQHAESDASEIQGLKTELEALRRSTAPMAEISTRLETLQSSIQNLLTEAEQAEEAETLEEAAEVTEAEAEPAATGSENNPAGAGVRQEAVPAKRKLRRI